MSEYDRIQKKTAGEILKEMRESKGLSVRNVHEITKIPMDVLKAIEEGYSVRTLSPFYLKGFIKMYSEYLGVEFSVILEKITPVLQKAAQPAQPKIAQLKEKTYKIYEDDFDFNRLVSKDQQRRIVQVVGCLIALLLCVKMLGCLVSGKDREKTDVPKHLEIVSLQKIAEKKLIVSSSKKVNPKEEQKPFQPKLEEKKKPVKEEKKSNKVRLTIKALKGGWLQVKVDGTVVTESTVKAGAVETWEADREIVISGRTIHSLEFELNGKMLGTLGRQDRNARRVVITKKGLAVKG